jgi:methyl-accepting chemotaxis protein
VRLNLRPKVMIVVLLPLVVLVAALGFTTSRSMRRTQLDGLRDKARSIAALMVEIVGPDVALGDNDSLDEKLGFVAGDRDFAFAGVRDPAGRPLAVRPKGATAMLAAGSSTSNDEEDSSGVTAIVPVTSKGHSLGTVVVRLSTHNVDIEQAENSRRQLGILAICLLFAGAAAALLARRILRPLGSMETVLERVAEGDLTLRAEVASRDELGRMGGALNHALDEIEAAMAQIGSHAASLDQTSQGVAAAAQSLSSGAQEQATSVQETAASLEEITGTVRQSAQNAQRATKLATGSCSTADQGGQVVSSAIAAMNEINQASTRIAAIITAINEIAFQTNLLALNAAVEAARAGEQGRGFAVVATEVRSLAQRTAGAAKEIKDLIGDSVAKVRVGSSLVQQSGETLGEIVSAVKGMTNIIAEMATASREQTNGIDQVNRAVGQIDHIVQTNATETEHLSSTSQGLADQAAHLQELVGRFTVRASISADADRIDERAEHLPPMRGPQTSRRSRSRGAIAAAGPGRAARPGQGAIGSRRARSSAPGGMDSFDEL